MTLVELIRDICAGYELEPVAVFRKHGRHGWPLVAEHEDDLRDKLEDGGHFLPLPREPAALANVLEVSIVDFLLEKIDALNDVTAVRGTERGYPDIEISGERFGGAHHALDVKIARRARSKRQTQSRITLYTGNTYFRYPSVKWPGTFRPFDEYETHLDLIGLYTFDENSMSRLKDLELIVHEAWRIASKQRSSTTREYLGAVTAIEDLRAGHGEFESEAEFYTYWRKYNFKIGKAVQQQLDKLLAQQTKPPKGKP